MNKTKTQMSLIQEPTKDVVQVAQVVETFRSRGANVLTVASFINEIPPDHRLCIRVIEFDKRDFFSTGRDRYAPSKSALEQIANAIGVVWRTELCIRADARTDPNYAEFRAAAAAPDPQTGLPRIYAATYALDLRDDSATTQEILSRRGGQNQLQQKRKFIVSLADTGARLRVIRQLTAVRSDYTQSEIARPFVCVAMIYQPGADDPELRRLMAIESYRARQSLYYGTTASNVGSSVLPPQSTQPGGLLEQEAMSSDEMEVFGANKTEEPTPLHYFDVEGAVVEFELDADIFAGLPRYARVQLTEGIIQEVNYDLEDAFNKANKTPKRAAELSDPALLRLYVVCLDKYAPIKADEDDIPF